ncbi:TonB-dependent receptor [Dyadobacter sandarakinus]|uniref:TonB-dependent receptor n=2 Tax=Dyadobacter sandarakinus TaxID=2747268 RepID=A0ABX7IE30_9BACT|nr:TonB-dependent receptor [Dyadobacter sandarakinus]
MGLGSGGFLFAQQALVSLDTVQITGFSQERFMGGLKVRRIDSAALEQFRFQNIGELLALKTPVAFKNYGPGQLNTASFRGTSASHTAVLWNGLNINSPILGQTDFSTIPVAGFDQLSVQFGPAASIVGSDAVGGSILLGSTPAKERLYAFTGGQIDRFHNYQAQAGARYSSTDGRFSGKTAFNGSLQNNEFPYTKRNGYSLFPSQTSQAGFVQDLFFRPDDAQRISAHFWFTKNRLVLTPDELQGRELTLTEAYRSMIRYELKNWVFRTALVRDIIDYAKGDFNHPDHSVSDRFANRVERDFEWAAGTGSLHVKTGVEWAYYRARVPGYGQDAVSEHRTDLFVLTRWQANRRLLLSGNLRQAMVTGYHVPFTPSAAAEYRLAGTATYNLTARASIARSYRVPTLNERYWKDLGNPDIKPEHGWNYEAGIEQQYRTAYGHVLKLSLAAYRNRIKDWTYWNPSKNYRVENLQQVLTQGLEVEAGWRYNSEAWQYGLDAGYALNKSYQEKAYDAYAADIVGKQLVFVPLHSGNVSAFIQRKLTRLSLQGQALSRRFTTFDNAQYLDGYALANLILAHTVLIKNVNIQGQLQVNNMANVFYLNVRNFAMPGRNFALSLVVSYKNPEKSSIY